MDTAIETFFEDTVRRRILAAADEAGRGVMMPMALDDEDGEKADGLPEAELVPGTLVAGRYDRPVLVLERGVERVRVVPTSLLSTATLASEAAIRFGRRPMVFCGWETRWVRVDSLRPAYWRGSIGEKLTERVREALGEGQRQMASAGGALEDEVRVYCRAASYPWHSCFPAIVFAAEPAVALKVRPTITIPTALGECLKPRFALAAATETEAPLEYTETRSVDDGTLTVRLREFRQLNCVQLAIEWTGSRSISVKFPSRSEAITLEPGGSRTLRFSTEELVQVTAYECRFAED